MEQSISQNPLLSDFNTIPFLQIQNSHFLPAFTAAIEANKLKMFSIAHNTEPASFKNTILPFEYSTVLIDQISCILINKNRAYTDEETQKICKNVSQLSAVFRNELYTNQAIFERINQVYQAKQHQEYLVEDQTLILKVFNTFIRNGILLGDRISRLKEINLDLVKLILSFEENLLAEKKKYFLHLTEEKDLNGLPKSSIDAAENSAKERGLNGWVFDFSEPSYIPFMSYNENRELRKKFCIDYGSRCYKEDSNDNQEIVMKIANLRKEKANLLGFKTHAEYVLKERMASDPKTVESFLNNLLEKVKPIAEQEFIHLNAFAKERDGIEKLEKWDLAFYSEKLKKKLFDLDEESLKVYFSLESVINGAFGLANKLYGLTFLEVENIEKFDKDVKTYEVRNEKLQLIAYFYADFFPRSNKQNGGWVYALKNQHRTLDGLSKIPHTGIFCNFPKATKDTPSLLRFNDVETLFHEFGHALHTILSNVNYPSLSGINVLWDFVEFPSQIMENWCYQSENLKLFAKNYLTGEIIPTDLIEKIKRKKNFLTGLSTLRQINFSKIDMMWHTEDFPSKKEDIKNYEDEILIEFTNKIPSTCYSVSFLHLFNQTYDYSAGYYSYHWAEVLSADAFEMFEVNGIFNQKIGEKLRDSVLSRGGSDHPMKLYLDFRGKEPTIDAFLKNKELIEVGQTFNKK